MPDQRLNLYPGTCTACRSPVRAEGGVIHREAEGGPWSTYCTLHAPMRIGEKEAEKAEKERKRQRRTLDADGSLWTPMEFSPLCKVFPGAKWDKPRGCWTVSLSPGDLPRVLELCGKHGIAYPEALVETVSTAREELKDGGADIPKEAHAYQIEGILFLRSHPGAILGDDPGLGKTLQALIALPERARAIIVCPATLKRNWQREANGGVGRKAWRPDLRARVMEGRQESISPPNLGEILIYNYEILPDEESIKATIGRYKEELLETFLIVDEAQAVKNYQSKRHKQIRALSKACGSTWLLTGTPLMNHPPDLRGLLEAGGMFKDTFRSPQNFIKAFHGKQMKWGGYKFGKPEPWVSDVLKNVMLRRTKAEVLPQLPPKVYQDIPTEAGSTDKDLQLRLDEAWKTHKDRIKKGSLPPFEEFSKIRADLASAKIPDMLAFIEQCEENEEPLIVFSAHKAPILKCGERKGWDAIHGETKNEDRQKIVERFQHGHLKGVAITIAAGGTGLTLTRSSTVLFVDLDWTPSANVQAEDRCHRIGSEGHESIRIVRLVAEHPLEQHVHKLLTEKSATISAAIDGPGMSTPMTVNKQIASVQVESEEEFLKRIGHEPRIETVSMPGIPLERTGEIRHYAIPKPLPMLETRQ
jgi:SWI/SNF-related matrix-associated actin-dependent regulator 1 of chromatin subfamily A